MVSKRSILIVAFLSLSFQARVPADLYLNGGIASSVDNGTGANSGEPFEYDSFDTPNSPLYFNSIDETSFLLALGTNTFIVTGNSGATGLGPFFTPSATQLTNASDFGRAPDLNVFLPSAGGFAFPTVGTQVATIGQFSGNKPYSGATSFTIGLETVTVVQWDGTNLQLNVTAAPEPSSIALIISTTILCFVRRRWNRGEGGAL